LSSRKSISFSPVTSSSIPCPERPRCREGGGVSSLNPENRVDDGTDAAYFIIGIGNSEVISSARLGDEVARVSLNRDGGKLTSTESLTVVVDAVEVDFVRRTYNGGGVGEFKAVCHIISWGISAPAHSSRLHIVQIHLFVHEYSCGMDPDDDLHQTLHLQNRRSPTKTSAAEAVERNHSHL